MIKEIDVRKIHFPNVSTEFSDAVNKYFFKKLSGQSRAAEKAKREVLETGMIDEKLLNYYYNEIWLPGQSTVGDSEDEPEVETSEE